MALIGTFVVYSRLGTARMICSRSSFPSLFGHRSAKRGLWALDSSTFEHPAEYKKRYKIGEDVAPATKNEVLSGGANAAGKVLNILSGGILRRAGRWWRAE